MFATPYFFNVLVYNTTDLQRTLRTTLVHGIHVHGIAAS